MNCNEFKKFFGNEMANNYHANELSASLFEIIIEDNLTKDIRNRPKAYHKMKEFLKSEN
jgi:hypothetical protein